MKQEYLKNEHNHDRVVCFAIKVPKLQAVEIVMFSIPLQALRLPECLLPELACSAGHRVMQ